MTIKPLKVLKRTKVIATLGPATSSHQSIQALLNRGVDVFRINFSHGDHETHQQTIERIHQVAQDVGRHVAVLADLCGPKIRVGKFKEGYIRLKNGEKVTVTTRKVKGQEGLICSQYKALHEDVKKGQRILLDDGKLELRVEDIEGKNIECVVTYGGVLSDKKGMNLPDTAISMASLTEKDKSDLHVAIACEVDFVALSFVRSGADVRELREQIQNYAEDIPIISKIERPEAIADIDEILEESDGIMIARGDLGIELAPEKVPLYQDMLINKARNSSKPVIVATQMMESMIESSRPTRAEVGDIANAVLKSTDAVMLSGETSVGKYPLQAVEYMVRTIQEIERDRISRSNFVVFEDRLTSHRQIGLRQAMSKAALGLAKDLDIRAFIVPTKTGTTARVLASDRPLALVLGVSHHLKTCRRMCLQWGVTPVHMHPLDFKNWRGLTNRIREAYALLKTGEKVIIVSGFEEPSELSEPVLKLLTVNES